jgi:hypothetical protein
MEREIIELRKLIAGSNVTTPASAQYAPQIRQQQSPSSMTQGSPSLQRPYPDSHQMSTNMAAAEEYMRPHEAVASLLDLRSGLDSSSYSRSPGGQIVLPKKLEDVSVVPERVSELFSWSVYATKSTYAAFR